MTTWNNQNKNTTSVTNQQRLAGYNPTWADMPQDWAHTEGTWASIGTTFNNQTKNTTVTTNQPKN